MNERIKELELEAAYGVIDPNGSFTAEEFNNFTVKFAELIIQECAKFLEENSGYDDSNNAWHPEPEDLLKHFEVEE